MRPQILDIKRLKPALAQLSDHVTNMDELTTGEDIFFNKITDSGCSCVQVV